MLMMVAFLQNVAEPASEILSISLDWKQLTALAINSVLVLALVQVVKHFLPLIPGGVKQLFAIVAGPLLMLAQSALSDYLGYPIDFEPLILLFAGLSSSFGAMGAFTVAKRAGSRIVVSR